MVMGSLKIGYETYGNGPAKPFVMPKHADRIKTFWRLPRLPHCINLKSIFLPKGYPRSVSKDYLEYQVWDTIQAVASSVTGALAGQAVMLGFGVGNAQATILGASLSSMLKDAFGMVSKISFAAWQGGSLDSDCKRWRLLADVFNDCALFLELMSPLFPQLFVTIVCASSALKSIVSVAGGATRAAVTLHQALDNNVADVAAKDGSQETMSNFLALLFNVLVIYFLTGKTTLIWFGFITLTAIHLYANYRAVRCLQLSSFNRNRFHIAVHEWFIRRLHSFRSHISPLTPFPTVAWVNAREPILTSASTANIYLGCSLRTVPMDGQTLLPQLIKTFIGKKYLMYCSEWDFLGIGTSKPLEIYVILLEGCQPEDQLLAMLHAELLGFLSEFDPSSTIPTELLDIKRSKTVTEFLRSTLEVAEALALELTECVAKSPHPRWNLSSVHFSADEWRYVWTL